MILNYKIKLSFWLLLYTLISCNKENIQDHKVVSLINNQKIYLKEVDSIIAPQLYELRTNAINLIISRNILALEAKNKGVNQEKLVEEQINKKYKKVTLKNVEKYIVQNKISNIDTANILTYLKNINKKKRQAKYVDSLKKYYSVKIKLQPSFFRNITTSEIYSHNLTKKNSKTEVFIISDFKCPSCQKAEKTLKELYLKYNNNVNFKFVFYSYYIDKSALACEAAAKQNKFKQMHDIIFENIDILEQDSVYYKFAKEIDLKINLFNADMKDKNILNKLIKNKELLKTKEIYSTPVFIVNGKVLDSRYSIDYLEDIINEELNK